MLSITPSRLVVANGDPNNLSQLKFDTNKSYLAMKEMVFVSKSFPSRAPQMVSVGGKKGSSSYNIPYSGTETSLGHYHGLGYSPVCFLTDINGNAISGSFPMAQSGPSIRFIDLRISSTAVWIRERYFVASHALPFQSISFYIYVMENAL